MTAYNTYIFDLDGTLLNTLGDLAASVNHAMRQFGMATHTTDEERQMVGNGIRNLIEQSVERALAKGAANDVNSKSDLDKTDGASDTPCIDEVLAVFKAHYMVHGQDTTLPYDGIIDTLRELRRRGKRIAVVSNKHHVATERLCSHFFGDTVEVAIGENEPTVKKKPAPDTVLEALRQLGVEKDGAVYVGDSDVDIKTAAAVGIPCVSVLWGFRDEKFLIESGATAFVSNPKELLL